MGSLRSGEKRLDDFPDDVVNRVLEMFKMSRQDLQARFDKGALVEKNSPAPGMAAPDFQLELMDRQGNRTGERVQLSKQFDKPVALIFGSYT
jgi:hypothetical protein